MEILPLGTDGMLLRLAMTTSPETSRRVRALAAGLEAAPPEGVVEIAGGLVSVLLRFDPDRVARDDLAAALSALDPAGAETPPGRLWRVPAAFGGDAGPQLHEAAKLAGRNPEAAIAELCDTPLDVLAIGFAPGQPYLGHLGENWNMPRQSDLTPRVPAGAIVVALRQIVLFNAASTTGWRQVGRTAFRPFLREREPPFALRPGDRVKFEPVAADEIDRLADGGDGMGGARCET